MEINLTRFIRKNETFWVVFKHCAQSKTYFAALQKRETFTHTRLESSLWKTPKCQDFTVVSDRHVGIQRVCNKGPVKKGQIFVLLSKRLVIFGFHHLLSAQVNCSMSWKDFSFQSRYSENNNPNGLSRLSYQQKAPLITINKKIMFASWRW